MGDQWGRCIGGGSWWACAAQAAAQHSPAFPTPGGPEAAELWEDGSLELGDIVISLETTARQCGDHAKDLSSDLLFLASRLTGLV